MVVLPVNRTRRPASWRDARWPNPCEVSGLGWGDVVFLAMREILGWSLVVACAVAIPLIIVDTTFVVSNMLKIADGGYIPLLLAGAVYSVMMIWHMGAAAVAARLAESVISPDETMALLDSGRIPRVPGAAVFLTRTETGVPPIIRWHLKHNRLLHERVFIFSVTTELVPFVDEDERLTLKEIAPRMWRACFRSVSMGHPYLLRKVSTNCQAQRSGRKRRRSGRRNALTEGRR